MEQALHLVQILAQYKAENMRLRHTCKDLEKQVSLVVSQYEEHCSAEKSLEPTPVKAGGGPEKTPEDNGDEIMIQNGMSINLDDEMFDLSS